jgi:hypothetical protein
MPAMVPAAASCVFPISTGFAMGPFACSCSDAARPSQNRSPKTWNATFTIGGDLRVPCWPRMPVECGAPSEKASAGW